MPARTPETGKEAARVDRQPYLRIGNADHAPQAALYNTSVWRPGDIIKEEYVWPIPKDAPAGEYSANVFVDYSSQGAWFAKDLVIPDSYHLGGPYFPPPFEIYRE